MVIELLFLTLGGLLKVISRQAMVYRVSLLARSVLKRIDSKDHNYVQTVVEKLALKDNWVLILATSSWIGNLVFIGAGTIVATGFLVPTIKPIIFIISLIPQLMMR